MFYVKYYHDPVLEMNKSERSDSLMKRFRLWHRLNSTCRCGDMGVCAIAKPTMHRFRAKSLLFLRTVLCCRGHNQKKMMYSDSVTCVCVCCWLGWRSEALKKRWIKRKISYSMYPKRKWGIAYALRSTWIGCSHCAYPFRVCLFEFDTRPHGKMYSNGYRLLLCPMPVWWAWA